MEIVRAELDGYFMSEATSVHDQIKTFLLAKFPLARKRSLDINLPLLESGIVDSVGVLDLVAFLEQHFSISVSDEELTPENFYNIQCLGSFVEEKSRRNGSRGSK